MYFSMSGAWMGPTPEEFQRWPVVTAALAGLPLADPGRQLRSFLAAHQVEVVIAAERAGELPATLGIRPIQLGGVSVYQLPRSVPATVSNETVEQLEEAAGQQWIGILLEAARRFFAAGQDLATLNPVKLNQLGLLPDSRWGSTLDLVLGGASHGAITPLWIGPGPNRTVAVGMFASAAAAAALATHYAGLATNISYPYPLRSKGAAPQDHQIEFLLITMQLDCVQTKTRCTPSVARTARVREIVRSQPKHAVTFVNVRVPVAKRGP
jgi:hypothetical protein